MAGSKIKLRNVSRRLLHFNLEHETFVNQQGQNGVGNPEVLTILPDETLEVDADVTKCQEVASALKHRPRVGPSLQVVG